MTVLASRLYELLQREGSSLFEGGHAVHTPRPLVEEMIGQISVEDKTILVMFNMEFAISLVHTSGVKPANITVYGDHPNKGALASRLGVKYITNLDIDMKFDVVIGNPPYQDGNKEGQQNKIYNQFSKSALQLVKDDGIVAFVTPSSVCKESKRFSLVNRRGLKLVDFRANNYFNVGVNICWWLVDNAYSGLVTVKHDSGEQQQSNKTAIYDYSKVDKEFAKLYTALKKVTDAPDKRMFKQNAVDAGSGRSMTMDDIFKYPVHKIEKGEGKFVQYNKPLPKFHNKLKFIVSMTKGFSESATLVDTKDYDVAHLYTDITNNEQVENIKSFIFSDYFVNHSNRWKEVDGYGYNNSLKHLPPFDKNKKWSNEEVKTFLESFLDAD